MNRNKALLPAVICKDYFPGLPTISQPQTPQLKIVWQKKVNIDYHKTTLQALLPVFSLVDNRDLFKIRSLKRGHREVRLSLVDLWEESSSYPGMSLVYKMLAKSNKEAAGIIELGILAQIMKTEDILPEKKDLFVLAVREYNFLGESLKHFPSITRYDDYHPQLGLTYDWVVKNHHALFLIVE
jgi:hypothetical protein